jgi:predicted RNA-binding protein with PIN domain
MTFVIDGHNLIGAGVGKLELGEPNAEGLLVARLKLIAEGGSEALIVFFDGRQPSGGGQSWRNAGVEVHFSSPPESADDAIVAYVRDRRRSGQFTVVTNDRGLRERAVLAGAHSISVSDFLARSQPARRGARHQAAKEERLPSAAAPEFEDISAYFLSLERAQPKRAPKSRSFQDLASSDEELAIEGVGRVVQALLLGQDVGNAMRTAVEHPAARVRLAVVAALVAGGGVRAEPWLLERLAGDAAAEVRAAAAAGLGLCGTRSALAPLERAQQQDPKQRVKQAARLAIEQIKSRNNAGRGGMPPRPR